MKACRFNDCLALQGSWRHKYKFEAIRFTIMEQIQLKNGDLNTRGTVVFILLTSVGVKPFVVQN